jgi:hypothetical protein
MTILGIELLLIGGVCALIAAGMAPGAVLAVYAMVTAVSLILRAAIRRPPDAVAALCLSFLSALPGALFYWEVTNRNERLYEELSLGGTSALWTFVWPVLAFISTGISRWSISPRTLNSLRVLHLVVWLLGTMNAWYWELGST